MHDEELRDAAADMRDAVEAARKDERATIVRWLHRRAALLRKVPTVEGQAAAVAIEASANYLEDPEGAKARLDAAIAQGRAP